MSKKLNDELKYYFIKLEELEKKYKEKGIMESNRGPDDYLSWITYSKMAKFIVKFLLTNTSFLDDCGRFAAIQYDVPDTYFKYDVEYDYEQELTRVIKKYYCKDFEIMVYGCNYLYNSQVKIDDNVLSRTYNFINIYYQLVFKFVDHIFRGKVQESM